MEKKLDDVVDIVTKAFRWAEKVHGMLVSRKATSKVRKATLTRQNFINRVLLTFEWTHVERRFTLIIDIFAPISGPVYTVAYNGYSTRPHSPYRDLVNAEMMKVTYPVSYFQRVQLSFQLFRFYKKMVDR